MCVCHHLTEQTIRQFNLVEFVAKCAKQTVVKTLTYNTKKKKKPTWVFLALLANDGSKQTYGALQQKKKKKRKKSYVASNGVEWLEARGSRAKYFSLPKTKHKRGFDLRFFFFSFFFRSMASVKVAPLVRLSLSRVAPSLYVYCRSMQKQAPD
jgi:hypothetical protein